MTGHDLLNQLCAMSKDELLRKVYIQDVIGGSTYRTPLELCLVAEPYDGDDMIWLIPSYSETPRWIR